MHLTAVIFSVFILCCASNAKPFDAAKDVKFQLYRRDSSHYWINSTKFTILRKNSDFLHFYQNPYYSKSFATDLPTRIYIHGYRVSDETTDRYRDELLSIGNFNFISVDWKKGAHEKDFNKAKILANDVSKKVAELIDALIQNGMNIKDLTLIGHGLGAFIIGRAAKVLRTKEKIGHIIALDPASMGYHFMDGKNRLDQSNADYVEVIHTDMTQIGKIGQIGHADFFVNRGRKQPGCTDESMSAQLLKTKTELDQPILYENSCSHNRANDLFWESLRTNFIAIRCFSSDQIQHGQCTFDDVTAAMAGNITSNTKKPHGAYYLETNADVPFAIEDYKSFKNIEIHRKNEKNEEKTENDERKSEEPNVSVEIDHNTKAQNETAQSEGDQNEGVKKDENEEIKFELPVNENGNEESEANQDEEIEQNERDSENGEENVENTPDGKQESEIDIEPENDQNDKNETKNDDDFNETSTDEPVEATEPAGKDKPELPNEFEGNMQNITHEVDFENKDDQRVRNETANENERDESEEDEHFETTEPNEDYEQDTSKAFEETTESNITIEIGVENAVRNETSNENELDEKDELSETTESNEKDHSEISKESEGNKQDETHHSTEVNDKNGNMEGEKRNGTKINEELFLENQTEANESNNQNNTDGSNRSDDEIDRNDEQNENIKEHKIEPNFLSVVSAHIYLIIQSIIRIYNIIVAFFYLLCACLYELPQ